jgi:hypothetical protein
MTIDPYSFLSEVSNHDARSSIGQPALAASATGREAGYSGLLLDNLRIAPQWCCNAICGVEGMRGAFS